MLTNPQCVDALKMKNHSGIKILPQLLKIISLFLIDSIEKCLIRFVHNRWKSSNDSYDYPDMKIIDHFLYDLK